VQHASNHQKLKNLGEHSILYDKLPKQTLTKMNEKGASVESGKIYPPYTTFLIED